MPADMLTLAVDTFITLAIVVEAWVVIIAWLFGSKRMIRWRKGAIAASLLFFSSLALNTMTLLAITFEQELLTLVLYVSSLVAVLLGFVFAAIIAKQIASWERFAILPARERLALKTRPKAEKLEKFGIPAIDSLMMEKSARAPFMILGSQGTHPWSLAHDFAADGMQRGEACIYIATTRPPELIIEQLDAIIKKRYKKKLSDFKDRFAIIDCFTPFAGFGERDAFPMPEDYRAAGWTYREADPRDLNNLHLAAVNVRPKLKGEKLRIIYDTFSTISELTDPEALYQYLMHQIAFEEKFGYISCYVVRKEEHIGWLDLLVAGTVKLSLIDGERALELVKMPGKFRPGVFRIDEENKVVRRITKPRFVHELTESGEQG